MSGKNLLKVVQQKSHVACIEGVCESGVWRVAIGKTTPETVQ
jgi:hypothetical protein